MLNYFEWNGVSSLEYGVEVEKLPPITIPKERVTFDDVPGRSGSLATLEGECVYDDVTLAVDCWMRDTEMLNEFAAWMRGEGRLVLPNREEGYYVGRLTNQIELERIVPALQYRRFTLTFRCKPFFYLDESRDVAITKSGTRLNNPGSAPSQPRIVIEGSGTFSLTIGMQTMGFSGVEGGGIIIDSELQDALTLDGALLANDKVSGDFFELAPGTNVVNWQLGGAGEEDDDPPGTVTKVTITPRWRCL